MPVAHAIIVDGLLHEWHYDDDHEYKPYPVNNVIAIGDYFDHYTKSCYHTPANCFDVKKIFSFHKQISNIYC